MATIKSYTDLQQSKKLAEILSLESADMAYIKHSSSDNPTWEFNEDFPPMILGNVPINEMTVETLPCWSLAALLSVLPNKIVFHDSAFEGEDAEGINDIYYKCMESTEDGRYMCRYVGNGYKYKCVADNPVDACYEIILKLNDLHLL